LVSEEHRAPSEQTAFFVYYRNSKGQVVGRSGVEVSRLGSEGVTVLSLTDASGELILKKEQIFGSRAIALLFCDAKLREVCAAVRVDSEFLKGFAEFNVHLPLPETIDRVRIMPK